MSVSALTSTKGTGRHQLVGLDADVSLAFSLATHHFSILMWQNGAKSSPQSPGSTRSCQHRGEGSLSMLDNNRKSESHIYTS